MHRYNEKGDNIVAYTAEELSRMPAQSDWKRVDAMTEEEITGAALSDPDNLPLDSTAMAKRGREALAEIFPAKTVEALLASRGRPKVAHPKEQVTIRLSSDVLSHFKAQGKGWQTRIDEALLELVARQNHTNHSEHL